MHNPGHEYSRATYFAWAIYHKKKKPWIFLKFNLNFSITYYINIIKILFLFLTWIDFLAGFEFHQNISFKGYLRLIYHSFIIHSNHINILC
jgi:hypothetical protein